MVVQGEARDVSSYAPLGAHYYDDVNYLQIRGRGSKSLMVLQTRPTPIGSSTTILTSRWTAQLCIVYKEHDADWGREQAFRHWLQF